MKNPLLVFDLDGTLIDSAQDIAEALNHTLKKYGKNPLPYDTIVAHIGEGLRKLLSDFFPEAINNENHQRDLEFEFLQKYEEEMFNRTCVFPGVTEFLKNYSGPIAIITNKNERPAKQILNHLGLDLFPWIDVFGADTLTEKKPSPLPLQTMMKKAGFTPQNTIMIGDGTPDMISAQRAGTGALAIGFGYTDVKILQGLGAHKVLHHYNDLARILENWAWSESHPQ